MDFFRRMRRPDDELTAFAEAVRTTLVEPPDSASAALLVPRLAEAARASAPRPPVAPAAVTIRPRRRWAMVARVAVAVASIPLLFAGLAFAGVSLPGPADSVFETFGVELPNQAADHESSAGSTSDGSEAGEPGTGGLENAAEKRGHGKGKSNKARDRGRGAQGKGRALGKRRLAPGSAYGHAKSKGSGGGGNGTGGKESAAPGQVKKDSSPGYNIPSGKAKGHSK
jgi:hypothetical protein